MILKIIKFLIVLFFLFCHFSIVLAQNTTGRCCQKDIFIASEKSDVISEEIESELISKSVKEKTSEFQPVSSARVSQVADSRNQIVLLIGDSMSDGLGARFNDYAVKNGF